MISRTRSAPWYFHFPEILPLLPSSRFEMNSTFSGKRAYIFSAGSSRSHFSFSFQVSSGFDSPPVQSWVGSHHHSFWRRILFPRAGTTFAAEFIHCTSYLLFPPIAPMAHNPRLFNENHPKCSADFVPGFLPKGKGVRSCVVPSRGRFKSKSYFFR